jgi:hypothetical protein
MRCDEKKNRYEHCLVVALHIAVLFILVKIRVVNDKDDDVMMM